MIGMATKRLYRSPRGKVFGVATGLAEWRDLPADPVRLIVFLTILFTGFFPGALIYLAAALIIPMNPGGSESTEHHHYHHYDDDDNVSDSELKALLEKKRVSGALDELAADIAGYDELIKVAKDEIRQIEDKLASVKQKYQMMVERSRRAREEQAAQETLRRAGDEATTSRFSDIEEQIDRMQAANELNRFTSTTLDEKFRDLEEMDDIDAEIAELRRRAGLK